MPELPEVETVKSDLQILVGQKLLDFEIFDVRIKLKNKIKNRAVLSVIRRGKFLIFRLARF